MRKIRFGFTLIELLVVIVLVALLSALLFPVFGRIQERGREVRCASNLRQLHTAAMSYISNNNGHLPWSASAQLWHRDGGVWREVNTNSWPVGWVDSYPPRSVDMKSFWWEPGNARGRFCITNGTLFRYLGDTGDESVYVCPTMAREADRTFSVPTFRVTAVRSYGMNRALSGVSYRRIDGVSRTIMFADQGLNTMPPATHSLSNRTVTVSDTVPGVNSINPYHRRFFRSIDGSIDRREFNLERTSDSAKADMREFIGEYHGRRPGLNTGMANVIFCDGHVERVPYTNTLHVCQGNWEYGRPVVP